MNDLESETVFVDGNSTPVSKMLDDFVNRRDQKAFAELVRHFGPFVYGVCRRVVRNHHDAEDAFQATFLVLAKKAASIQRRETIIGWLYRVAFQISLRAKSAIDLRRTKEEPMSESLEPATSDSGDWSELEPILDQEISQLAEIYRVPVLLCDLGGCTQKEAAKELGWSEGTLSTRLLKARSILAERLTRHGFALSAGTLAVLVSQNTASAALPASLIASTLQATSAFTVGQAIPANVASSKVVALA